MNGVLFFLLIFFVGYIFYAWQIPFGSIISPGPGFFPIILGLTIIILIFIIWVSENVILENGSIQIRKLRNEIREIIPTKRPLLFCLSIGIFIFLLPLLGYLLSSFFLLLCLFKVMGVSKWKLPITLSLLISIGMYVLFSHLDVPLPVGLLENLL